MIITIVAVVLSPIDVLQSARCDDIDWEMFEKTGVRTTALPAPPFEFDPLYAKTYWKMLTLHTLLPVVGLMQ